MKRRVFLTGLGAMGLARAASAAQAGGPGVALIFIGASWCPYCAQIAPLMAPLPRDGGVPILVASLDNRPIAPFAEHVDGRAHPLSRGTARIPQVLVFNHARGEITHAITHYRTPRHFVQLLGHALRQSRAMVP